MGVEVLQGNVPYQIVCLYKKYKKTKNKIENLLIIFLKEKKIP